MKDYDKELDEILQELVANQHEEIVIFGESPQIDTDVEEAKQRLKAIINSEVRQLLDRLEEAVGKPDKDSRKTSVIIRNQLQRQYRRAIEAERKKYL